MFGLMLKDASEGDVETQIVVSLLTRAELLGIPHDHIRSKEGISARDIGKGSKRKVGYIPDYCVYKKSLPVCVVEAKAPLKDVAQAYAVASLYALELNRSYPHNLNPCCRIIATNGISLLAGRWDTGPEIDIPLSSLTSGTSALDALIALVGNDQLEHIISPISEALRSRGFKRPC